MFDFLNKPFRTGATQARKESGDTESKQFEKLLLSTNEEFNAMQKQEDLNKGFRPEKVESRSSTANSNSTDIVTGIVAGSMLF